MPDKLTDSEIVESLIVHISKDIDCGKCHYDSNDCMCSLRLQRDVFDLINRLQAEKEELVGNIDKLKAELFNKTEQLKTAKAEAYEEFAEW